MSEVAPKQLVTKGFSPPPFSRNQIPGKRLAENSFIPSVPHHRNIREKSFCVCVLGKKIASFPRLLYFGSRIPKPISQKRSWKKRKKRKCRATGIGGTPPTDDGFPVFSPLFFFFAKKTTSFSPIHTVLFLLSF